MRETLMGLFLFLIGWFIVYLLIEFRIVSKKKKNIEDTFNNLDGVFYKRFEVLTNILDIIKVYNKLEFEDLSSKLYDYMSEYNGYEINYKLDININIESDIKRILLSRDAYSDLNSNLKYVRLEKQLKRYNRIIYKGLKKYNKAVSDYNYRLKMFPSNLIIKVLHYYNYKLCSLMDIE